MFAIILLLLTAFLVDLSDGFIAGQHFTRPWIRASYGRQINRSLQQKVKSGIDLCYRLEGAGSWQWPQHFRRHRRLYDPLPSLCKWLSIRKGCEEPTGCGGIPGEREAATHCLKKSHRHGGHLHCTIIETLENMVALRESLAILVVAPQHGAGEMRPQDLQWMANMIISQCYEARGRIEKLLDEPQANLL